MPEDCEIKPEDVNVPTPDNVNKHCPPKVDALKSYFRYNISCQTKDIFESKNIKKSQLEKLKCDIGAVYPWDELYNTLRINLTNVDVYPLVIFLPTKKSQVEKAFDFTQKYAFNFSCRGGAHNNAGYSLCNGIVIDQHLHNKVEINNTRHPTAVVSAGCLNGPTLKELAKHDLALVTGTCPDTGIAGLTLGGGFSYLMRRNGMTIDNLLNIEMILPNGRITDVNEKEHPDLFWACRGGGGGNFGLVLNYKFKVEKLDKVSVFQIIYPFEDAVKVLDKWQVWAPHTDNDLTAELQINNMTGNLQVIISGQFVGCEHHLKELIKPILGLAKKEQVYVKEMSFVDACRFFSGSQTAKDCRHEFTKFDPPNNDRVDYFRRRTRFSYHHWDRETLHRVKKHLQKAPPNSDLILWALGGNIRKVGERDTAFPHRKALWFCIFSTYWSDPFVEKEKHIKWLNDFYNSMNSVTKGCYVNFSDPELDDYLHEFYAQNKNKLIEIKSKYDKSNVFNFPQSIPVKKH
jgi:FAD/FMN-containing dehydrogenase